MLTSSPLLQYEAMPSALPGAELAASAPIVSAVIAAAGTGTRMDGLHKQFALLGGLPVVAHTLLAFERCAAVTELIVVCRAGEEADYLTLAERYGIRKLAAAVPGGTTRIESAALGAWACRTDAALIAVHDGARPLIDPDTITAVIHAAAVCGGAACAVPVKDTIKTVNEDELVTGSPPRFSLRAVQTPQIFERMRYFNALAYAQDTGFAGTDDCGLMAHYAEGTGTHCPVQLVPGRFENLKITTPEDLVLAEALLNEQDGRTNAMRVGHGYDVHRLVPDRPLILGGVTLPYERGLLGHSDADVLTHAITDALLGAAALGDLGRHFPDTDERFRGANSLDLLKQAVGLLRDAGFVPHNLDATVVAQAPKIAPYIADMRRFIAVACGLPETAVSIKATTEEGLGFTGRGEGIAAHAVCTITAFRAC